MSRAIRKLAKEYKILGAVDLPTNTAITSRHVLVEKAPSTMLYNHSGIPHEIPLTWTYFIAEAGFYPKPQKSKIHLAGIFMSWDQVKSLDAQVFGPYFSNMKGEGLVPCHSATFVEENKMTDTEIIHTAIANFLAQNGGNDGYTTTYSGWKVVAAAAGVNGVYGQKKKVIEWISTHSLDDLKALEWPTYPLKSLGKYLPMTALELAFNED